MGRKRLPCKTGLAYAHLKCSSDLAFKGTYKLFGSLDCQRTIAANKSGMPASRAMDSHWRRLPQCNAFQCHKSVQGVRIWPLCCIDSFLITWWQSKTFTSAACLLGQFWLWRGQSGNSFTWSQRFGGQSLFDGSYSNASVQYANYTNVEVIRFHYRRGLRKPLLWQHIQLQKRFEPFLDKIVALSMDDADAEHYFNTIGKEYQNLLKQYHPTIFLFRHIWWLEKGEHRERFLKFQRWNEETKVGLRLRTLSCLSFQGVQWRGSSHYWRRWRGKIWPIGNCTTACLHNC